jgi:hypothetical protein
MVQEWTMPSRAPSVRVLGPCPSLQANQAMYAMIGAKAFPTMVVSMPGSTSSASFDTQVPLTALNDTTVKLQPTLPWFLDSCASSHMSDNSRSL